MDIKDAANRVARRLRHIATTRSNKELKEVYRAAADSVVKQFASSNDSSRRRARRRRPA